MVFGFPVLVVFRAWLLGFHGWLFPCLGSLVSSVGCWFSVLGGLSRALVPRFRAWPLGFAQLPLQVLAGLFSREVGGAFPWFCVAWIHVGIQLCGCLVSPLIPIYMRCFVMFKKRVIYEFLKRNLRIFLEELASFVHLLLPSLGETCEFFSTLLLGLLTSFVSPQVYTPPVSFFFWKASLGCLSL
ncbi:hypothetical protein MA16_Dca002984 [Dendrobium catenatum]|uniref:Uncharacterized protein n=1 Tax=Dendrobium catenatum TaxID=906689 RepID=A0A2I0X989_9ASPA|nr:hypothetical protein MA16_Dca002984 [Dendrobium catenatum]